MKIKTISRTESDYTRATKNDIIKVHRNRDPRLHPHDRAREYSKAVVGAKLNKMFAKPFIGSLDGHSDGVYCVSTLRKNNLPLISGACNGEIILWDLPSKNCVWKTSAHHGFVRGIVADLSGRTCFSCGDDKTIKQWSISNDTSSSFQNDSSYSSSSRSSKTNKYGSSIEFSGESKDITPIQVMTGTSALGCIDHHWNVNQIATGGDRINIWDVSYSKSIVDYSWGADSITSVSFNPAESSLLASTGTDRSTCLYDLRVSAPMRKQYMAMKSNKVIWHPREPYNFMIGSEDANVYSFDMRYLDKALMVYKDHVSAVMDVAFSPSGKEFVSGGYDRTIRLFNTNEGRSKDMYHTKRMQRIFSVKFSADAQYVISGSDDTNLRIWKAHASDTIGLTQSRKQRKEQTQDALHKKFSHMPEVRRIVHSKPKPKAIKKATELKKIQIESQRRKLQNMLKHNKKTTVIQSEKEKAVGNTLK